MQETTDQSDAAPAAELQRNALLTQLTGKWTFDNCGAAAMFSIQGDTLFQSWPDVGPAAEQIVGTTGDVVETRVIAPVKQRGQLFRYHPSATRLVVDDVRHGRSGTLQRCP